MNSTLKDHFIKERFQFILSNDNGKVIESDNTFFNLKKGFDITDIHPFFESLAESIKTLKEPLVIHCVHFGTEVGHIISDVQVHRQKDQTLIVIHDLTHHYSQHQQVAQRRNESVIDSELVLFKNKELEARENFKNSFIQNFSHELRNPLTGIISITNLLEKSGLTSEQKKMVAFLKESNTDLKGLLEDILNISLINSNRLTLNPKAMNLVHLLQQIRFAYFERAREKSLDFQLEIDKKIPEIVEADRIRIFQILANLVENALKYTAHGGITLKAELNQKRAKKASVRFSVIDTGKGIHQEDFIKIFDSFTQLELTNKGNGIGLSIVKGLVNLMDSEIKIDSKPGEGSTFYFDLTMPFPFRTKQALTKHKESAQIENPFSSIKRKKYRVLVVEDDQKIQMILFKALVNAECFYVDLVSDGDKVISEINERKYDLILMNVQLPTLNGVDTTKLIRSQPLKKHNSIPIIGITGHAYEAQKNLYKEAGMNEVIAKPFEESLLYHTIYRVLK